ncbi:MAG: hypothetical protein C0508_03160, partial [Cyanobacteria bacterium PR.023]|jgi:hypothetical protein|nr:hypothetical protein [Cyanobacteria bacterium PR.023]MBX9724375.1 hypothetical protein [Candidatus Obscuribacterales bacterium]
MSIVITRLTEVEVASADSTEVRWLSESEIELLSNRLVEIVYEEMAKKESNLLTKLNYPAR